MKHIDFVGINTDIKLLETSHDGAITWEWDKKKADHIITLHEQHGYAPVLYRGGNPGLAQKEFEHLKLWVDGLSD